MLDEPDDAADRDTVDNVDEADSADDVAIANGRLRPALEFAFEVAVEANRRGLPVPPALAAVLVTERLDAALVGRVRRAIAGSREFRAQVGVVAPDAGVDELGVTWLRRPQGWAAQVVLLDRLADERERREQAESAARREQRRREAAESKQARLAADVDADTGRRNRLRVDLDEARTSLRDATAVADELRRELTATRTELRHATDRQTAAERRRAELEAALARHADHTTQPLAAAEPPIDVDHVRALTRRLATLADDLLSATDAVSSSASRRRSPLALPGAVTGDARAATEHLLRSDAEILVDGYNVAKLGWPPLALDEQREQLVGLVDDVIRRFGSAVTIVFDGADVVGAAASGRRLARVTFSPRGITADDVLVDLVDRLPPSRPVVVVTDDAELRRRVRRHGANLVASATLLDVGRR